MAVDTHAAVDAAWRAHWGRLLALLVGRFRDVDLAEDALAEAFEAATRRWPVDGVPTNPAAWLLTTARRRALDRLRGADSARRSMPLLVVDHLLQQEVDHDADVADTVSSVGDDELAMLLLACHPALSPESQAALALRTVLGVPTIEIARLFLVTESTMAARLTRAKRKLQTAGIPLHVPQADALDSRIEVATQAIYLAFTAGYAPSVGDAAVRVDLAGEAIRLTRVLVRLLARRGPAPDAVVALLALQVLQHARRDARVAADGSIVLLADQDRTRWHHDEIDEGLALLASVRAGGPAETMRLQAVLASRHAVAVSADDTDWSAIAADYAVLESRMGSPIVRLHRAVAVAMADGPMVGLRLLDGLEVELPRSHRLAAVRGELLTRLGDVEAARAATREAIDLCGNEAEAVHLRARLDALDALDAPSISKPASR